MAARIDEIEGIGPNYRMQLKEVEIETTDDLLRTCGASTGREIVGTTTGISTGVLLKWANMADLMRINGVARQFAELLEASGVDTVKELSHRKPENLAERMAAVNADKKLSGSAPSVEMVRKWVAQAAELEPAITH